MSETLGCFRLAVVSVLRSWDCHPSRRKGRASLGQREGWGPAGSTALRLYLTCLCQLWITFPRVDVNHCTIARACLSNVGFGQRVAQTPRKMARYVCAGAVPAFPDVPGCKSTWPAGPPHFWRSVQCSGCCWWVYFFHCQGLFFQWQISKEKKANLTLHCLHLGENPARSPHLHSRWS